MRHLILVVSIILSLEAPFAALGQDEEEFAKYQPPRDYGHDWRLGSLFGITPEDGILVGTGAILYEFGFRVFPYVYRMELVGGVTLQTGRWKFAYSAWFPSVTKKLAFRLDAYASELEVRNFYGFGNNSVRIEQLEKDDFYRVSSREYFILPKLFFKAHRSVMVGFATSFKHFQVRQKDNRFLNNTNLSALGNDRSVLGFGVSVTVDNRDYAIAPHNGVLMELGGWNYPDPFQNGRPFQRIYTDNRFYFGDTVFTDIMAALRFGGEKLFGSFPFYEVAFLGGANSLRGFRQQRFGGDASMFGAAEIRFSLVRLKLLIPTEIGLFVLGEAGRVWLNGQTPGGWHTDVGGGIWLAPLSRDLLFNVSLAKSVDGLLVNGGFGFAF